jgi:hypothetical protein
MRASAAVAETIAGRPDQDSGCEKGKMSACLRSCLEYNAKYRIWEDSSLQINKKMGGFFSIRQAINISLPVTPLHKTGTVQPEFSYERTTRDNSTGQL